LLVLKIVTVWFIETLCGVLFLGLFSTVVFRVPRYSIAQLLGASLFWVIYVAVRTGYAFTTLVCRLLWSKKKLLWYPACATALCIVHGLYYFLSSDTGTLWGRFMMLTVGAFAAFVSTLAGSYVLLRWEHHAASKQ
jgi:hypothetical protein